MHRKHAVTFKFFGGNVLHKALIQNQRVPKVIRNSVQLQSTRRLRVTVFSSIILHFYEFLHAEDTSCNGFCTPPPSSSPTACNYSAASQGSHAHSPKPPPRSPPCYTNTSSRLP